jgi:hypothetical protein
LKLTKANVTRLLQATGIHRRFPQWRSGFDYKHDHEPGELLVRYCYAGLRMFRSDAERDAFDRRELAGYQRILEPSFYCEIVTRSVRKMFGEGNEDQVLLSVRAKEASP